VDQLFCLRMPQQKTNWGDYGDMLRHGMTNHLDRSGESLQLERTGPFVPPVTFPGASGFLVRLATALTPPSMSAKTESKVNVLLPEKFGAPKKI
jgi:hypothetical protein